MVEAAIVLPFAFLMIFSSIGLGMAVYQNLVVSNAVRSTGRSIALAGPATFSDCEQLAASSLKSDLERFGFHKAPVLATNVVATSGIRGLNVHVIAELNCELCDLFLFSGSNIRFEVESYYPLENQNACL